ncbi:MAG: phytanoyl-CoA dioxygenase family protein [Pseudomonadota bacterium]
MQTKSRQVAYREYGYFVERKCFTTIDTKAMTDELDRLWNNINPSSPPSWVHWRKNTANELIQDRIDPICPRSELFDSYSKDPRIVSLVNEVLGDTSFVLKAKAIMKRPATMGYGAHQDLPYWDSVGLKSHEVLTAAIALDEVTKDHGPLELYGKLHHERLPSAPDNELDVDPRVLESVSPEIVTMKPGDVAFFDSLVPHSSGPNTASSPRRMFLITYAKGGDKKDEIIANYNSQVKSTHAVHRVNAETA